MNVHILASRDIISHFFFYPLFLCREALRAEGVTLKFFSSVNAALGECDVVIVDNRVFSPLWQGQKETAIALIEEVRSMSRKVIWADVTDSSGATQFQVMPYVDRYWKKQLLKDRKLYLKQFYGARVYTDYYKNKFQLPEEKVFSTIPADVQGLNKLRLSWNLGLGPCHESVKKHSLLRWLPEALKQSFIGAREPEFFPAGGRSQDICFRGSRRYNNRAIGFQREKVIDFVRDRGGETSALNYRGYIEELRRSRVCLSPFGAGEICFRDFEIIVNGGTLFKPDMSHLETWPDVFVPQETYIPFAWDFSDLNEELERLLSRPEEAQRIAQRAQECYRRVGGAEGQKDFVTRFTVLVRG